MLTRGAQLGSTDANLEGLHASVSAGRFNNASAFGASVSGGYGNTADGYYSTVSGGTGIVEGATYGHAP
jgi:hypothetical protein